MALSPIAILSLKWTLPILLILGESKSVRFNTIKKILVKITPSRLSITLKEMEIHGVVEKQVLNHSPAHTTYSLTNEGMEFFLLLQKYLEKFENKERS